MIAASRLRKAHDRIIAARPFSKSMVRVLSSLAGRVDAATHPLLAARDDREPGAHILLLVITADKGLAGGFNANVIRAAAQFIVGRHGQRVSLGLVGRKGRDFFRRRSYPVRLERTNLFARLEFNDAKSIAKPIIEDFVSGEIDAVYIVYNEFKSIDLAEGGHRAAPPRPTPGRGSRGTGADGREPGVQPRLRPRWQHRRRIADRLLVRAGRAEHLRSAAPAVRAVPRSSTRCSNRRLRSTPRA